MWNLRSRSFGVTAKWADFRRRGNFQPADDIGFRGDRFLQPFFHVGRHFGTRHAEQVEIREATCMKTSLVERTSGCGTPREFSPRA